MKRVFFLHVAAFYQTSAARIAHRGSGSGLPTAAAVVAIVLYNAAMTVSLLKNVSCAYRMQRHVAINYTKPLYKSGEK